MTKKNNRSYPVEIMSIDEALKLLQKLSNDHMNGKNCDLQAYNDLRFWILWNYKNEA